LSSAGDYHLRTVPVLNYLDHQPRIVGQLDLAADAYIVGNVSLSGPAVLESSAVVRADRASVAIAAHFHMGRGSSIHVDGDGPTQIGRGVWLGAGTVVHGCTLGDGVRVEDGGLVLSHARVGQGSIVAAGALVTEGATFVDNSYIAGSPGRWVRETTVDERAETARRAGAPHAT
jgi:carbonic anhydrase/acetyltransferase-like protein (isoleucine patch superfamily)